MLCRKWGISELAVFGSVLRDDFGPGSDVDVLVTFAPGGGYTFETLPDLLDELSALFGGRTIDLVEKPLITNPFRRHEILTTRCVLYAA
jgi:predicted nucleotidyltransferase